MNRHITLIVADDHPMLLKGLLDQLVLYNYTILDTATNGSDALDKITALNPKIAILDVEMPHLSGFEVIKKCQEKNIDTKFIILSSHKERGFVHKAQTLNIMGYIIKDEPFIELHHCIQSVNKGVPCFSSEFNVVLEEEVTPQLKKIKLLSRSEITILKLVAQGMSSKDIGEHIFISPRTVEKHRSNIISKLNLTPGKGVLVLWAKEHSEFFL